MPKASTSDASQEARRSPRERLLDEYRDRIKSLTSLSNAIKNQGVQVDKKNNTVNVSMKASELADLAKVETEILHLKREMLELEEEMEGDDDDL